MLELDHVILGVRDLAEAAARLRDDLGLGSVEGGRHVGVGTHNRIVPLGPNYVEVLAVADPDEARAHPFGRWVLEQLSGGDRFLGWGVRTDGLEAISVRLDLGIESWSRERPDGALLRWRMAGLESSVEDPSLPFFVQWEVKGELHPAMAEAEHAGRPEGIVWLEVAGDPDRLASWLGGAELPIRGGEGEPGVLAAGLMVDGEERVLRPSAGP